MCSKWGVSGYPTLKAFKRGEKVFDYEGPRDAGKLEMSCRLFFLCAKNIFSSSFMVERYRQNTQNIF